MLIPNKHSGYSGSGQRVYFLDMGGDSPPPPDYTPVANASEESARIAAELGREQIAEARRQYDLNMEVTRPVVEKQLGLMDQTKQQGDEYFENWKSRYLPVEEKLIDEANRSGSEALQEQRAGEAMADVRQGTTAMQNQLIRQGLRYGYSPAKLAAMSGTMAGQQGLAMASAGNTARNNERNLGYARKLEVAGLGRGMTGAANAAYTTALQSGNSATGNQMAPGAQLLTGMNQGANTTMTGQGQRISGLGSVLNAQSSVYNNNQSSDPMGTMLGLGASLLTAPGTSVIGKMFASDRRLKQDIDSVGLDQSTGLTLYEFSYIDDPEKRRYIGVMADEVESKYPAAVAYDDLGYAGVDYDMLGIQFKEI